MKKILIPTDFSQNSKNAIRYALDLFKETPCHYFLLYVNAEGSEVIEKPVYDFGTNIGVKLEQITISEKLLELEEFVKSISYNNKHHQFTTIREDDFFLTSIRRHLKEKDIDLIVMGTQGASQLKEFFTGTRSGDVITKVESDVLVIPNKAKFKNFKQVVFSVDFELHYSDDVLQKIAKLISSEKAVLNLLFVTKSQIPIFEEVVLEQKQLLQRLSKILPNPINCHRVISKKVEEGVNRFAESLKADLIIMISKDYGLIKKLFLDTTVEEVSFDTKIPLLSLTT